jgi:predicted transcriptional regulator
MPKISIQISDEQAKRLSAMAERFNVTVEELAGASVRELLVKPDERFEEIARRVLEKNDELYRRLA